MASRFENNVYFALRKETAKAREGLPLNQIEKIGDKLSWFAYGFKDFISNLLFDPRTITVCFTAFAMILNAILFYPSNTLDILSTIASWIIDYIDWNYVRFCLWFLSEITIFGLGLRAFGRFTNQQLLKHYDDQNVVA